LLLPLLLSTLHVVDQKAFLLQESIVLCCSHGLRCACVHERFACWDDLCGLWMSLSSLG
jgi:hypothetical protein